MKKLNIALALVGALGVAACSAGTSEETGSAPENDGSAVTAPIDKAESAAADLANAASTSHTLTFNVEGMT